jgi:hypothetical protein
MQKIRMPLSSLHLEGNWYESGGNMKQTAAMVRIMEKFPELIVLHAHFGTQRLLGQYDILTTFRITAGISQQQSSTAIKKIIASSVISLLNTPTNYSTEPTKWKSKTLLGLTGLPGYMAHSLSFMKPAIWLRQAILVRLTKTHRISSRDKPSPRGTRKNIL